MIIELALEDAEVLVEDAQRDDGEARPEEGGVRADVPGAEDDAGVDDVGVPRGGAGVSEGRGRGRGEGGVTRACSSCIWASWACRVRRGPWLCSEGGWNVWS